MGDPAAASADVAATAAGTDARSAAAGPTATRCNPNTDRDREAVTATAVDYLEGSITWIRSREAGGVDHWHTWSCTIKTAVSGKNGDVVDAAEMDGARVVEELVKDDEFVDANRATCIKVSRENFTAYWRDARILRRRRSRGP